MTSSASRDKLGHALSEIVREQGLYLVMVQARVPVTGPLMRWGHAVAHLLADDLHAALHIGSALRDYSAVGTSRDRFAGSPAQFDDARLSEALQRASVVVSSVCAEAAAESGEFTRQTLFAVERAGQAPALVCCQIKTDGAETWESVVGILSKAALAYETVEESAASPAQAVDHTFTRFMARVLGQRKGSSE